MGRLAIGERSTGTSYGPIYRNLNDNWLRTLAMQADEIVVAWGASEGPVEGRADAAVEVLTTHSGPFLKALGTTKDGSPRHPLYVRADAPRIDWPLEPATQED